MSGRQVTIVVHSDGDLNSRQYRVPVWAFEAGRWTALGVGLLVVLFFAFAGPIGHAAARVPWLDAEVARLRADSARVQQLAVALSRAEANYQELRELMSGRQTPAGRPGREVRSAAGPSAGSESPARYGTPAARSGGPPPASPSAIRFSIAPPER